MLERRATVPRSPPADLSNLAHRRVIGLLGLVLPAGLYVVAGMRRTEGLPPWVVLDSISAYFYTGAVALFVGVIFSLSLFLFTYRGYSDVSADRVVGAWGGVSALAVALFPTRVPEGLGPLTWWSPPIGWIHGAGAASLFVSFIVFSIWLFRRSSVPLQERPLEKRVRDAICLACGLVMSICVLWAASSMFTGQPIFLPESIAIEAFAISWLVKGDAHGAVLRAYRRIVRAS